MLWLLLFLTILTKVIAPLPILCEEEKEKSECLFDCTCAWCEAGYCFNHKKVPRECKNSTTHFNTEKCNKQLEIETDFIVYGFLPLIGIYMMLCLAWGIYHCYVYRCKRPLFLDRNYQSI